MVTFGESGMMKAYYAALTREIPKGLEKGYWSESVLKNTYWMGLKQGRYYKYSKYYFSCAVDKQFKHIEWLAGCVNVGAVIRIWLLPVTGC